MKNSCGFFPPVTPVTKNWTFQKDTERKNLTIHVGSGKIGERKKKDVINDMKFKRIDDSNVRCVITQSELADLGINIEDLFCNAEKQQKFFCEIVDKARDEVGFKAPKEVVSVNIMPLPNHDISITLSENPGEDFRQVMKQAMRLAASAAKETLPKVLPKAPARTGEKPVKMRIYGFQSMHDLEQYCDSFTVDRKVKSSLFKDERKKQYYLIIEKGRLSLDAYNAICNSALDFGEFVSCDPSKQLFIVEHFNCLIKKHAVNVLKSIE